MERYTMTETDRLTPGLTVDSVHVSWEGDEDADLSYLDTSAEGYRAQGVERLASERYVLQDQRRRACYLSDWWMVGCTVEATVSYPINDLGDRRIEWFTSGGLWGIESDSDSDYLRSVEKEQLHNLRDHLERFGIDPTAYDAAVISRLSVVRF